MNPFNFPKAKHFRTKNPKNYKRYQTYKKILRIEFSGKCVYCCSPVTMRGGSASFGVDHYRPKSLFHSLVAEYSNLYYCCNSCNSNKNDYWPSEKLADAPYIPNPCDHVMFQHLRFEGAEVKSVTSDGEFTRELLDLNDPNIVEWREYVLRSIGRINDELLRNAKLHKKVVEKFRSGKLSKTDADEKIQYLMNSKALLERDLRYTCGIEWSP